MVELCGFISEMVKLCGFISEMVELGGFISEMVELYGFISEMVKLCGFISEMVKLCGFIILVHVVMVCWILVEYFKFEYIPKTWTGLCSELFFYTQRLYPTISLYSTVPYYILHTVL